ncbi:MAG: hypothetical protein OQK76_09870 [Gammaproteobacteria bacterium]|nr:hypothetical protein [Gammaproteobacteria bacterium]
MRRQPAMSKQQAIDELRKQVQALEDAPCSVKTYAAKAYKIKIRRDLADKLERELEDANIIDKE